MSPRLKEFLQRWAITTVAVVLAERIIRDIQCDHWLELVLGALILGVLNAVLRPLLVVASLGMMAALNVMMGVRMALLTLPLQVLLFGFLLLAINAVLLLVVAEAMPSFHVAGFWAAFWGGVVISLVTLLLNSLTGSGRARFTIRRGVNPRRPGRGSDRDDRGGPGSGNGPVIDV